MASGRSPRPVPGGTGGSDEERPGPLILLVEDDPRVRDFLVRVLSEHGHRVEAAADGDEALALCERLPRVDLLITDVVMPGMSGTEVADQLARRVESLAVLYISGYSAKAFPETVALPPEMDFLPKPFNVTQLLEKVDRLLRPRRGGRAS